MKRVRHVDETDLDAVHGAGFVVGANLETVDRRVRAVVRERDLKTDQLTQFNVPDASPTSRSTS